MNLLGAFVYCLLTFAFMHCLPKSFSLHQVYQYKHLYALRIICCYLFFQRAEEGLIAVGSKNELHTLSM